MPLVITSGYGLYASGLNSELVPTQGYGNPGVAMCDGDFSLDSVELIAPAWLRVRFTNTPKTTNPIDFNDALNPLNYSFVGPTPVTITQITKFNEDDEVVDIYLSSPLVPGIWQLDVSNNVASVSGAGIQPPLSYVFNVDLVNQEPLSLGAENDDSEGVLRKHLHPALKGRGWDAVIAGLAAGDKINQENARLAFNQLYISTSASFYLDRNAGDQGVKRPPNIGISDDLYRQLAIVFKSNQLTQEAFLEVLEVFYGTDAVKAYVQSDVEELYTFTNGATLSFLVDEKQVVNVVFNRADFARLRKATAIEVAYTITRTAKEQGSNAFAIAFKDPVTAKTYVRIYSGSRGLSSGIRVTGGTAQATLQFSQNIFPIVGPPPSLPSWEISIPTEYPFNNKRVRFNLLTVGFFNLQKLHIGDYVIIRGSEFLPGNRGQFRIVNVVFTPTEQYFEVENQVGAAQALVEQCEYDCLMLFRPIKRTIYDNIRFVVVAQHDKEIDVVLPATTQAVGRHMRTGAYAQAGETFTASEAHRDKFGVLTIDTGTPIENELKVGDQVIIDGLYGDLTAPEIVLGAPSGTVAPNGTVTGSTNYSEGAIWSQDTTLDLVYNKVCDILDGKTAVTLPGRRLNSTGEITMVGEFNLFQVTGINDIGGLKQFLYKYKNFSGGNGEATIRDDYFLIQDVGGASNDKLDFYYGGGVTTPWAGMIGSTILSTFRRARVDTVAATITKLDLAPLNTAVGEGMGICQFSTSDDLHVAGGYERWNIATDKVQTYSKSGDSWSLEAPLPRRVLQGTIARNNENFGQIMVVGGRDPVPNYPQKPQPTVLMFDFEDAAGPTFVDSVTGVELTQGVAPRPTGKIGNAVRFGSLASLISSPGAEQTALNTAIYSNWTMMGWITSKEGTVFSNGGTGLSTTDNVLIEFGLSIFPTADSSQRKFYFVWENNTGVPVSAASSIPFEINMPIPHSDTQPVFYHYALKKQIQEVPVNTLPLPLRSFVGVTFPDNVTITAVGGMDVEITKDTGSWNLTTQFIGDHFLIANGSLNEFFGENRGSYIVTNITSSTIYATKFANNPPDGIARTTPTAGGTITVVALPDNTATFTHSGTPFISVVEGDTVLIPGLSTGGPVGPFNTLNEGDWVVVTKNSSSQLTLARPPGQAFQAFSEGPISITFDSEFQVFNAGGLNQPTTQTVLVNLASDDSSFFQGRGTYSVSLYINGKFLETFPDKGNCEDGVDALLRLGSSSKGFLLPSGAATGTYLGNIDLFSMYKDPVWVKVATTTDTVLSGLQIIDGFQLEEGHRVLVLFQSNPSENGVYTATAGAWSRSTVLDTSADFTLNRFYKVELGDTWSNTTWGVDQDNTVVVGVSAISFTPHNDTSINDSVIRKIFQGQVGTIHEASSSVSQETVPRRIEVKVATTRSLEETFPDAEITFVGNGSSKRITIINPNDPDFLKFDSLSVIVDDRILIKDEGRFRKSTDNGVYVVKSFVGPINNNYIAVLARTDDLMESHQFIQYIDVVVATGEVNASSEWILNTPAPIVVDTTAIRFGDFPNHGGHVYNNTFAAREPFSGWQWRTEAPMAYARYGHAMVSLPDGRHFVFGGRGFNVNSGSRLAQPLSSCEVFEPSERYWRMLPPMACERVWCKAKYLPAINQIMVVDGLGIDPGSEKIVSNLVDPENAGSTSINFDIEDYDLFPENGNVYIGIGTTNFEGPIAYSSKTDNVTYGTLNFATPLVKSHAAKELVNIAGETAEFFDLKTYSWVKGNFTIPRERAFCSAAGLSFEGNDVSAIFGGAKVKFPQATLQSEKFDYILSPGAESFMAGGINGVLHEVLEVNDPDLVTIFKVKTPNYAFITTETEEFTITKAKALESAIPGPYMWNPASGVGITSIVARAGIKLSKGHKYSKLPLLADINDQAPSLRFPNEKGFLSINFGTNRASQPIPYLATGAGAVLSFHENVVLATNTPLPPNVPSGAGPTKTLTGANNGLLIVDGISVSVGDRILVKNLLLLPENNGIYEVIQTGSPSLPFILTRAPDFNQVMAGNVESNAYVLVEEGHSNYNTGWRLSNTGLIVLETTPLTFLLTNVNELVLDGEFEFPENVDRGDEITLLFVPHAFVPENPEELGSFYVTDSPSGRVAAQKFIEAIKAAGFKMNLDIVYPGDRGLAGEGFPDSDFYKLSDQVMVWAGSEIDEELSEAKGNG